MPFPAKDSRATARSKVPPTKVREGLLRRCSPSDGCPSRPKILELRRDPRSPDPRSENFGPWTLDLAVARGSLAVPRTLGLRKSHKELRNPNDLFLRYSSTDGSPRPTFGRSGRRMRQLQSDVALLRNAPREKSSKPPFEGQLDCQFCHDCRSRANLTFKGAQNRRPRANLTFEGAQNRRSRTSRTVSSVPNRRSKILELR